MRVFLEFVRIRSNLIAIVAGGLLIGFIGLLVGINYLSQMELRQSALEHFRQDAEKSTLAVNYFFLERRNDLKDLAGSRAISAFFENKALGMSMEYGLRASLRGISDVFYRLLTERNLGDDSIYTQIAFIDSSGKLLVNSRLEGAKREYKSDWKRFLTPGSSGAGIFIIHDGPLLKVMVSIPYFYKNKYSGQIVAWISPQPVYNLVVEAREFSKQRVYIVDKEGHFPLPADMQYENVLSSLPDLGSIKTQEIHKVEVINENGARVDILTIQVPVKDTPFSLITLLPTSEVFGRIAPWHLPLAMGVLSVIILSGMVIAIRTNMKKEVFHARLEESSKREKEIEGKNRRLGREIAIREKTEKELQKAHDELEIRVKERTMKLSESNVLLKQEIEERKRMEKAFRESDERIKGILRSSPVGIGLVINRTLDWANERMYRMVGYEEGSLLGQSAKVLYPDDEEYERTGREIKAGIEKSGTSEVETRWVRKDGTVFDCSIRACYLNPKDPSKGQITAVTDISEAKAFESQLQQAQKMEAIGTLSGGIAHDFNNILGSILGYTELSILEVPEGSKLKQKLLEVFKAGKRAETLIQQILAFSRKQELEQKPLQLKYIVKESLKLLRSTLPTDIEIKEDIAKDVGVVNADPTQMQQVIMNLCTNAGHAMQKDGGVLAVGLANVELDDTAAAQYLDMSPGPYLRFSVSDTGYGMTPDVKERIFEPFFTTKAPGEGTGLGLSVVHGIVKSHGGTITVYSEPGKGSTFHIYLPLIQEEAIKPEVDEQVPILTGNERILFIDDEQALADLGKQMLEHLGYKVTTRTSSIEALELFKAQPDQFDLVITDMTMPKMTGDKLAQELMKIRPDIPIIICTGHSRRISEEKTKGMGIKALVMKPLMMRDIANTVRKVLEGEEEKPAEGLILVIDDDDQFRGMLRETLEHAGYEVMDAPNGKEGIRVYRENPADLVITDIIMPEKEGIETIRELKREFPDVKIIAMSGGARNGPAGYLKMAKMLGAQRTLTKPLEREELLETVMELINE